jgi:hypothetical protein
MTEKKAHMNKERKKNRRRLFYFMTELACHLVINKYRTSFAISKIHTIGSNRFSRTQLMFILRILIRFLLLKS